MSELLEVRIEKVQPGTVIFRFKGEFAGMEALREEPRLIKGVDDAAGGTILAEMGEVTYIDSAAIGILYKLIQKCKEKKAKFVIAHAGGDVKKILETAKVHKVAEVW